MAKEVSEKDSSVQEPIWSCQLVDGEASITVGDVRTLTCQGDAADFESENLQFKFKNEDLQYSWYVLEVSSLEPNSSTLKITSYKPGLPASYEVRLTDGEHAVLVEPLDLNVQSILPPDKKIKPYGSFGPLSLPFPLWLYIAIGVAALIVLILGGHRYRKYSQRKRMLEELEKHQSPLGAYRQFAKDSRRVKRKFESQDFQAGKLTPEEYIKEIGETFRMYVLRKFKVPAFDWSVSQVLGEIKKHNRANFDLYGDALRKVLGEVERAEKRGADLSGQDCHQLLVMSQRVAAKVEHARRF